MPGDDVPPPEMHWFRHRDEIDAVLGDDQHLDDDLSDVAVIVHDLRSAYLSDERLPRQPALAAITGGPLDDKGDPLATAASNADGSAPQMAQMAGLPNRAPDSGGRSTMKKALAALTATIAAKIALGTAIAAASVAGLHAAAVVDIPFLPDRADERAVIATQGAGPDAGAGAGADADADEGTEAEEADGESEHSLLMQAWSACVDEASAARDEAMADYDASVNGPPGRFDPEEACGERPRNPAADGAQGPSEEMKAFVAAMREWGACVSEHAPNHATECSKPDHPRRGDREAPEDDGDGPPAGKPEGTPGQPEGTPDGPPEGRPDGPPEGTPGAP